MDDRRILEHFAEKFAEVLNLKSESSLAMIMKLEFCKIYLEEYAQALASG